MLQYLWQCNVINSCSDVKPSMVSIVGQLVHRAVHQIDFDQLSGGPAGGLAGGPFGGS